MNTFLLCNIMVPIFVEDLLVYHQSTTSDLFAYAPLLLRREEHNLA